MKNLSLTIIITLAAFAGVFGQTTERTKNTVDQSLRSTARVNPSTLAMEMSIPIASFPGRNGHTLPLVFNYSSKLWRFEMTGSGIAGGITEFTINSPRYAEKSAAGWTSSFGVAIIEPDYSLYDCNGKMIGEAANPLVPLPPQCSALYYMNRVRVKLPDGSNIELRKDDATHLDSGTIDFTGTYLSTDSTRARLELGSSSSILYMPDGSRYFFDSNLQGTKYQDESGNEIEFANSTKSWTDTLGRQLVSPIPLNLDGYQQDQEVGTDTFEIPGLTGGDPLEYSIVWKELDDSGVLLNSESLAYTGDRDCPYGSSTSNFLFQGGLNTRICQSTTTFNPVVMHELILPNGAKYKFQYNKHGEITKIHYPTGGYERFAYGQVETINYRTDFIYDRANRGVTDRWVRESSTSDELHWTYETIRGTGTLRVKTTAPDGYTITDNTVETNWDSTFGNDKIKWGFDNPNAGKPYDEKVYYGTTLYSRTLTENEYTGPLSGGVSGATRDGRVKRSISIVFEPGNSYALASMTEMTYDTSGNSDIAYFSALNPKEVKTYNYVAVSATTAASASLSTAAGWFSSGDLAKKSESIYLYDSNYKTRNINGLVTETLVKDPSGNVKAKTQISYDESSYLTTTSGTMPTAASGSWTDLTGSGSTEFGSTVGTKRGLPTTVKSYHDIANSYYIDTHTFFDQFGNAVKSRDGRGNDSTTVYDDDYAFAYPTSVTTPVPDSSGTYGSSTAFTSSSTFDYNTGLPLTVTDANGAVTTMTYADALLRPTSVKTATGTALEAQTVSEYGAPDSSGQYPAAQRFVKVKSQIDATNWKEGYTWADGLGRTIRTQSVDAESGDVFSMTCYDSMGRVAKSTNPFRNYNSSTQNCATTNGSYDIHWTTNTYDNAGRLSKVTTPDGAEVETTYGLASTSGYLLGSVVTVEDQAGKLRRSVTNALGQLKRVDEPNSSNVLGALTAPNQDTSYAYDYLNNLVTVTQGSQTRTFTYDNLSRLKSAVNPESGTISYTYDSNSNLTTKVDARSVTTNYTYDRLNRVTERSYAMPSPTPSPSQYQNSPTVNYYYDNLTNAKGKLKKVTSSVSTTEYTSFDILGRVTAHKQTTDGTDYTTSYAYNLGGALIEETYPSTRKVQVSVDANGDLANVQSKENSSAIYKTYANDFTYNAAGAVTSLKLGNGKFESTTFNSRLQPTQIALGHSETETGLLKLVYTYGSTDNNGNVLTQTITVPGMNYPLIQTYTYDSLNRLDDANETSNGTQTWRQDFTYDRYGNRNFVESNTSFAGFDKLCNSNTELCATLRKQLNPGINSSNNNRINSGQDYTYDSSGNTLTDANDQIFVYDAENKQVKASNSGGTIGEYYYDGDGKRVKKVVPGTGETTIFVYDAAGKQIAEYSTIVANSTDARVAYLTSDHLGSPRINTDVAGAITSRHDYHPFGEETSTSQRTSGLGYADDTIRKQFTGYERDNETDLDYAQARFYDAKIGRFVSTDPILISRSRVANPQLLNEYTYVGNNPLNSIDPTGNSKIPLGQKVAEIKTDIKTEQGNLAKIKAAKAALEAKKSTMKSNEYNAEKKLINQSISGQERIIGNLEMKLSGTVMVTAMLDKLSAKGQLNGLKLEDFSLSTDPEQDFNGRGFENGRDNAFVAQDSQTGKPADNGEIYIDTNGQMFKGATNETGFGDGTKADWIAYGASALRHEQWHRDAGSDAERRSERLAYRAQLPVLVSLEGEFETKSFFNFQVNRVRQKGN